MRVVLRTPDSASQEQLERVLSSDRSIHVTIDEETESDVLIFHAELFEANGRSLSSVASETRTVVAFAPSDPDRLSGYLAAGARGYHCVDEPWDQLLDTLYLVAEGGVRSDPHVMDQLLQRYRQLIRDTVQD